MALCRLETVRYSLPFREPYVTARGELRERDLLLVRIEADEGVGLGETTSLSLRGGTDIAQIEREVHVAWSHLRNSPLPVGEFDPNMEGGSRPPGVEGVGREAWCAVELALWDLRAKAAGEPLWRLLGGQSGDPVRCNATLVADKPAAVARDARRWADRGFTTFKLKAGVDGDVEQVAAARAELGETARLRVDANGAWTEEEARKRLGAMAAHDLELAEEPVSGLDAQARLRAATGVPLYADETVAAPEDARDAATRGACDGATIKLAKTGGIEAALEIAGHLPVYLSSALEGPVGVAAAAHIARAIPDADLAHGLATQLLFADWPAQSACELDGDLLRLPDAPGIGVELDGRALASHRK